MEAATGARQSAPTVAPARWQLRVLGELRLAQGAQQVERFPSRAVAALLVRLALWPDRAHAREELVELLWPGIDLPVGRNRLRQALSTLRALVEPPGAPQVLQADRLAVRLVPGTVDCDALQFEAELRAGRPALALALYRGELLPGHYDGWIADERLRLEALAERAAQAGGGRPGATVVPAAEPVVGAAATAPGPGAALPSYLTRYFEAGAQLGALGERLREHRLVTLTGPGGSGKTRLAVELARVQQARAGFDLVAFLPLAACNDPADLPERLLGLLQPGQAGGLDAVVRTLAGRHALLVLDNLEQLLPAASQAVASLLAALPHLHVLATSRRRLDVDGELEWSVEPLSVPEADAALEDLAASPALALFVDRARAARADFHLGPRNAAALAALVRALEGMPLAIELAASRVRSFSPAEMAERLARRADGQTPRLDLLERQGPRAGFDARHASMDRTIAWSWSQLEPADAQLLAALTLFDGGFTAAAASALVDDDDVALRLDGLRAHSLLSSREQGDGSLRFALYEPIREFAARHLAAPQAAAGRSRLRAWWLAWAQGLPATPPLARLRAELPNLTAAVAGAVADGVPQEALHLALALRGVLADVGAPAALLQALDDALQRAMDAAARQGEDARDDRGLRSGVHSLLGTLLFAAGQRERALDHVAQGLALAPAAGPARARALHSAASVRWRAAAPPAELAPLIAEGLAHAGADTQVRASLVALQAYIANQAERDYARGEALHREALALWSASGNRLAIHAGRYNLAMCAFNAHRWAEARLLVEDVVASTEADEDWRQQCRALNLLGLVLAEQRDWAGALTAYRRCVDLAWRTVWPHMLAYGLWNAPRALAHLRRPLEAARLMSFAAAHWQAHFGALVAADRHDLRRVQRLVGVAAGPAAARAAWAEGAGWTLADAVAVMRRPA